MVTISVATISNTSEHRMALMARRPSVPNRSAWTGGVGSKAFLGDCGERGVPWVDPTPAA